MIVLGRGGGTRLEVHLSFNEWAKHRYKLFVSIVNLYYKKKNKKKILPVVANHFAIDCNERKLLVKRFGQSLDCLALIWGRADKRKEAGNLVR